MSTEEVGERNISRLVQREALQGRIDDFLLARMDQSRREFVVREVVPDLSWNRLDLAIKLFYLESTSVQRASFAEELYDAHIYAFSLGDFREPGNSAKLDSKSFKSVFADILRSMESGFDPACSLIPVATDGTFINGGHRTACAMFLRQKVHVVETGLPPVRYDFRYFRSRGMSDDLLEAAVVKYAECSDQVRVALIAPNDRRNARTEAAFKHLVYSKQISLTQLGRTNLRDILSDAEERSTIDEASYQDAQMMLGQKGRGLRLRVYLFEADENALQSLRRGLGTRLESGSFFVPNSREATLDLIRVFLNDRSMDFLNQALPNRYFSFNGQLTRYRADLDLRNIPRENVVLGPKMLLAAYGLREAENIDAMMTRSAANRPLADLDSSSCENEIHDILQDPRRHLHYLGIKFLSPAEGRAKIASSGSAENSKEMQLLSALAPRSITRQLYHHFVCRARLNWSRVRRAAIRTTQRFGLRRHAQRAYDGLRLR